MRSRYSASVLRDEAYLLTTWHPSTRPPMMDFAPDRVWLGLKISLAEERGDHGVVAFVARSRIGGRSAVLDETSRFIREEGRWYYVDGDIR